jgi:hypothetical protein
MGIFTRRTGLAYQCRKSILAEPLAKNSYLRCIAQKFAGHARNLRFSTQSAYFVEKLFLI